jgi:alkylation response protein AidB-like acyl-CoA dehydrogenase
MDFKLTDEQIQRREEYFEVCKELEKSKPASFAGLESIYGTDEGWEFNLYCAKEFAKRGWLALGWPPEYGGIGTMMDRAIFAEARGYHDIPGVDIFGIGMLGPTLIQLASDEIKKVWLPRLAAGESFGCELYSEPNAGSDLAGLSTTAIRKGDEYIINGQKTWTSGAHRAEWGFGLFKTDPAGRKRHNISFLLIDDIKAPGIEIRPIPYMNMGLLYNEVYFDDVHVPVKNLVGKENDGWAVSQLLLGFERSGLDMIMGMLRWLEDLVAFCNETKRNGKPLAQDPIIRNRLAEVACEIEAARTFAYRVADLQSRNEMSLMEAGGVKVFASEIGERFAFLATDILGPYGQVKFSKWAPLHGFWEKQYQENFVFSVSMGTNEIQRNIIAWYGLGLPRMR